MRLQRLLAIALLLTASLWTSTVLAVTAYPYGTLPAGAADADLTAAYSTWKTRRLVTATCGSRVDNGGGGTYSEGMGYGMLMAAYLEPNDTLLAQLWQFYSANLDPKGVMNWSVGSGSCSNNNANAATDGDLDAALALVKAAKRWPASSNNWSAKATQILNAIYTYEVDSCKGLTNGDTWGGCTNGSPKNYNPSYFRTGYLPSFDCFEGGSRWSAVRTKCYSVLNYAYTNYALPPDWVQASGQWGASDASGGYGYDSCRTPWAVGMDYLWWGNTTSQNWGVKVTNSFYTTGGSSAGPAAAAIGDDYNYTTGAKNSNNHENEFIGAVGVAAMASTNTAFLNALYTELKNKDNNTYFSDSLKVIYLMALTGNFQEPCNGGGPVGTATRTPTVSPTPTASPTATPAFSLTKTASTASSPIGAPFTYYLDYANLSTGPNTSGVTPGVSLIFDNAGTGSSATRTGTNFQVVNASGGPINLQNYRIRYFVYDASHVLATDYTTYKYSDSTSVGAAAAAVYSPAYTGGPRNANAEEDVTFGSYSLANGANSSWQGAFGSAGDAWTMTMTDDWSYPGSVAAGAGNAASSQYCVLEQNVAGTWKPVAGQYPGGSAAIANVTLTDVLDSRLTFVSSVPTGTWNAGSSTLTVVLASLAPGAAGRVTITAQFNGTATVGNVVPNSAGIGATGYPSRTSNVCNVTVGAAAASPTPTATRTASPTVTPSRTPSPSVTLTRTPTLSPSPTLVPNTNTFTASPTPTSGNTLTATPSATASRTASGTPTATWTSTVVVTFTFTSTATRTNTLTATSTATATRTATATASPTATATATRTATASATPTSTATETPSITLTDTPPPPDSTPTATRTITGTFTATGTATQTLSPSPTASPSASGTDTPTGTATSSITPTSTGTTSPTASPSVTLTFTATPSRTPGPSSTSTPTRTATGTLTATPVVPVVVAVTATGATTTGGYSVDVTGSNFLPGAQVVFDGTALGAGFIDSGHLRLIAPGHAAGSVVVSVLNPGGVASTGSGTVVIAGPVVSPTPTPVATSPDGPLDIADHRAWPNPYHGGGGQVSVKLQGRCDRLVLKVYSKAMVCLGKAETGSQGLGWAGVPLPGELAGAPNGLYYYEVQALRDNGQVSAPVRGKLVVLR